LQKAQSAIAANSLIGADGKAEANGSGIVYIGGIPAEFPILKDQDAATILEAMKTAINAVLSMPAKAGGISNGELVLTAKWSGEIGNSITVQI
jgi:phage tail sheath gpL-like